MEKEAEVMFAPDRVSIFTKCRLSCRIPVSRAYKIKLNDVLDMDRYATNRSESRGVYSLEIARTQVLKV